jgi:hypothetical protein
MVTRAAHILALADELRSHALRCGHDLNSAHLFAHTFLHRAIAARTDLAAVSNELRTLHERTEINAEAA